MEMTRMTIESNETREVSNEIVNHVTATANDICRAKGYAITYKESDVKMILTAMMIVNRAINKGE
jgi:hypothetical protein